jgi:DNA-binding NarL/FixJ family response regulator
MAVPPFDKPIVSPVLVGRAQEMEALERALRAAQGGAGQCIVITGDAGVGKSRLLAEIGRRAGAERFLTLEGYCFEQDVSFPYAPLVDALRTYLTQRTAHRAPSEIREALGPLAPEIVKLVPELALVLPDLRATSALDPEAEKHRLFESLTQFLLQLAATQPLLIILEDLHWSDQSSLDFLQAFARRLAACPIVLLLSYRREEAPRALNHLLAQFDREHLAREITLDPLTRADVDAMLRAIFDLPRPVKAELLDLLHSRTEGNPFFIEEVLKALIAGGEIYYTEGRWDRRSIGELHVPRSVRDAVQRRMEHLGEVEGDVLTLAAVAGRRFGFALLREANGMDELELLQVVKQLIAAQLVVEESADRFAFRHALTHEAVYATLLRRERQALHRRVAEALERLYAGALEPYQADLAYHYYTAEAWEKALQYTRLAGEKAQALYAPHEAIEHFSHALEAAQHMALPLPTEIQRARGRAFETVGNFDAARGDYERALGAAREAYDTTAQWQALIDLGYLWSSRDYAQTGEYFRQALALARQLGEPSTLAYCLNRLGNWHVNVEQPSEALAFHREALAIFQGLEDRRGLAQTLDLMGMANYLGGDLIQCTACYEQAIALFRELDDRPGLASSLASLTISHSSYQSDTMISPAGPAEAVPAGEAALKIAREIGSRAAEAYAQFTLGFCLGAQGEYGRALQSARASLEIAEEIEHRQWVTAAHNVLGALYLDMLALPEAREHLEATLTLAQRTGSWHWVRHTAAFLASTLILQHELAQAEFVLNTALGSETATQTVVERLCWSAQAELACARRDPARALQIVERLLASAANLSGGRVIPRLWKLRGEALAALGRADEAEADLLAAREAATTQGARPLLWRIHVALGKLYQARARRDEAEAEYSAARACVQALAASVSDEGLRRDYVERALATMPRPPAPHPTAPSTVRAEKEKFGGLTAREREVAVLIARGKSNREIAGTLVVGLRTVEAHVTRILNKLGFGSRAEIAAWAVGNGLLRPGGDDKSSPHGL